MIFTAAELTTAQRDAWDATRTALLMQAPYWSHLLYALMTGEDGEQAIYTDEFDVAACDEKHIFINPVGYLQRDLGDRVFILAHEICHGMFNHAVMHHSFAQAGFVPLNDGTKLPYDDNTMQRTSDYYVNDMLVKAGVGKLPGDATIDPRYTCQMALTDIYAAVYKEQQEKKKDSGGKGKGSGSGEGFDKVLPPGTGDGKLPEQAMHERDATKWENEIEAAVAAALSMGSLPGIVQTMLGKLTKAEACWSDLMRAMVDRKVGGHAYDWKNIDRRMITRPDPIIAPGKKGPKTGLVVVIGDSSGSCSDKMANHFLSHMEHIIDDLEPERLVFAWCDAKLHGWEEVESLADIEVIARAGAKGRGGTDFRPVFTGVEELGEPPALLIYMTDGFGIFPKDEPTYQVIWADITGNQALYPWGDYVHIPQKGR